MLYLKLLKSRSEWQHTRHGLSHALLNCRRNWNQGWTRLELRSCWARVFGSVERNKWTISLLRWKGRSGQFGYLSLPVLH
jgi:hypothetical protein